MYDSMTLTLMGTGSSGGVPRVGNVWGDCDPDEPRNRRRRCSLLIEREAKMCLDGEQQDAGQQSASTDQQNVKTTVIVDTGADLREQLLAYKVTSIEGVVLTHSHADHIFGLDDLRQMAINLRRPIDVWIDNSTRPQVMAAFEYCFHQAPGSSYPAFCTEHKLTPTDPFVVDGPGGSIRINTLIAEHGDINALGVRVGNAVYLPDMKRITDPQSLELLADIDVLIVDALRYKPHPSHMNLEESLEFIDQVKPRRAILTNMHGDLDYQRVKSLLPEGVEPGFDGLQVQL